MLKAVFSLSILLLLVAAPAEAKGWETWDDCRLATYEYYDGDSFHVVKGGKDKIFRLYAVDTAETSDEHADRVKEQQGFFRATKEEILGAGKTATELTHRLLQNPSPSKHSGSTPRARAAPSGSSPRSRFRTGQTSPSGWSRPVWRGSTACGKV